jgi:hypothetical protein
MLTRTVYEGIDQTLPVFGAVISVHENQTFSNSDDSFSKTPKTKIFPSKNELAPWLLGKQLQRSLKQQQQKPNKIKCRYWTLLII